MNFDLFKILSIFFINFCMCCVHVWTCVAALTHMWGWEDNLQTSSCIMWILGIKPGHQLWKQASSSTEHSCVSPKVCISNVFQNQVLRSLFLLRLRRKSIELKRFNWKFENIGMVLFLFSVCVVLFFFSLLSLLLALCSFLVSW